MLGFLTPTFTAYDVAVWTLSWVEGTSGFSVFVARRSELDRTVFFFLLDSRVLTAVVL